MPKRYSDLHEEVTKDTREFTVRKRRPPMWQMLALVVGCIVLMITFLMIALPSWLVITLLCLLLATVSWFVLVEIQRSRDLVLATEFQNALFASALGFNNKFCIIIKQDGTIIYTDMAFQEMFRDLLKERLLTIHDLMRFGKVMTEDQHKIMDTIDRGTYDKVIFDICGSDRRVYRMVMSVEPILRPSGFILLRGREYIEQRTTKGEAPSNKPYNPLLHRSSITLFSYIMDKMNMGVYMTDPTGNLVYANPVLEQWLGYQEGEIISGDWSLKDIIHQGATKPGTQEIGDFEGEVTFQKKAGGLMKGFINQKLIQGERSKMLGAVALVHNIVEGDNASKKKLW